MKKIHQLILEKLSDDVFELMCSFERKYDLHFDFWDKILNDPEVEDDKGLPMLNISFYLMESPEIDGLHPLEGPVYNEVRNPDGSGYCEVKFDVLQSEDNNDTH